MLGGLDPIIIFQLFKDITPKIPGAEGSIPIQASKKIFAPLGPPIPVYLSENLTGFFIDTEDKNVDIGTDTETLTDGSKEPDITQKGVAAEVTIQIQTKKDSIIATIISAMIDLIYDKVTSKEYSITYLHGATTVFNGLLHSYSVSQTSQNNLMVIKIGLSRGSKNPIKPNGVPTLSGAVKPIPGTGG